MDNQVTMRRAVIKGKPYGARTLTESIEPYLPSNYKVVSEDQFGGYEKEDGTVVPGDFMVVIEGHDNAGWTLDGYVLPRLASGLYFGEEVTVHRHDWLPAGYTCEDMSRGT